MPLLDDDAVITADEDLQEQDNADDVDADEMDDDEEDVEEEDLAEDDPFAEDDEPSEHNARRRGGKREKQQTDYEAVKAQLTQLATLIPIALRALDVTQADYSALRRGMDGYTSGVRAADLRRFIVEAHTWKDAHALFNYGRVDGYAMERELSPETLAALLAAPPERPVAPPDVNDHSTPWICEMLHKCPRPDDSWFKKHRERGLHDAFLAECGVYRTTFEAHVAKAKAKAAELSATMGHTYTVSEHGQVIVPRALTLGPRFKLRDGYPKERTYEVQVGYRRGRDELVRIEVFGYTPDERDENDCAMICGGYDEEGERLHFRTEQHKSGLYVRFVWKYHPPIDGERVAFSDVPAGHYFQRIRNGGRIAIPEYKPAGHSRNRLENPPKADAVVIHRDPEAIKNDPTMLALLTPEPTEETKPVTLPRRREKVAVQGGLFGEAVGA